MKRTYLASIAVLCCVGIAVFLIASSSSRAQNESKFKTSENPIPNRYIVVLQDDEPELKGRDVGDAANTLAAEYTGTVDKVYRYAIKGYSVTMTREDAERLSADPRVKYVEEDGEVFLSTTQNGATWGLDRIDQRSLPLDTNYSYQQNGTEAHVYVIDTGIRATHTEFGGRAILEFDAIGDGQNGNDCHGHGTHVAGTIGGATYGVAKQTNLHAVRVLNCTGSGSVSGVVAGVDWVTANGIRPAVANMSLGGDVSAALDLAVENSIISGVTYAIAAGNANGDACSVSPARTPNALTVGASDQSDQRAFFSNWGTCLDIFAPGMSVASAWNTTDNTYAILSGTSMASPHVAGVAAQYLSSNPTASPADVREYLRSEATLDVLGTIGVGSPNLLLYAAVEPPPVSCSGTNFVGTLPNTGSVDFQSSRSGFSGGTGVYSGRLRVPNGLLGTLILEQKQKTRWLTVAASSGTSTEQTLLFEGRSGKYRWRITSLGGSGSYSLCAVNP